MGGLLLLILPLVLFPQTVAAAPCALQQGEHVRIVDIVDGDTVVLADGREVRMIGIQAPKLPLGRKGFAAWPLSPEAKARLVALSKGKQATLRYGGEREDRHGRVLAHIFAAGAHGEVWLQRRMLEEGLARVYTFPDNRSCAAALLAAEQKARKDRRGIWRDPYYAVRKAGDAEALERLEGRFELVEGAVVSAALVRNRLYLNFGSDYREDFTVTVNERDIKLFQRTEPWASLLRQEGSSGRDIRGLAGTPLRIRGWLGRYNGPEIVATHPEQIEFPGAVN